MKYDLILKNVSKHIQLDENEIAYFTSLLAETVVKKKQFLLRKDDICRYENFVVSGCLRVYSIDEEGNEHIVMFAIDDWWTSDMYSFLTQTPAKFYIDALEDTTVLQMSKANMELLFEKVPKFERFFRVMMQNAFIAQQQRIDHSLSLTAEERYLFFLNKYPLMVQKIPQKYLASYLGFTPEFLSMIRRKITKA